MLGYQLSRDEFSWCPNTNSGSPTIRLPDSWLLSSIKLVHSSHAAPPRHHDQSHYWRRTLCPWQVVYDVTSQTTHGSANSLYNEIEKLGTAVYFIHSLNMWNHWVFYRFVASFDYTERLKMVMLFFKLLTFRFDTRVKWTLLSLPYGRYFISTFLTCILFRTVLSINELLFKSCW